MCLWAVVDSFDHGTLFLYDSNEDQKRFGFITDETAGEFEMLGYGTAYNFKNIAAPGSEDSGWHHYCHTYDGTDWVFYFDGAVLRTETVALNTGSEGNRHPNIYRGQRWPTDEDSFRRRGRQRIHHDTGVLRQYLYRRRHHFQGVVHAGTNFYADAQANRTADTRARANSVFDVRRQLVVVQKRHTVEALSLGR